MTMLADAVDAVVGIDTHRDTHTLEIASPAGAALACLTFANSDAGHAQAAAFIAAHAPGPRLVVAVEGTRSYGVGVARWLGAAGLPVVEVERPARARGRRGKSDPIDAHLACLQLLAGGASRLAAPRADGDREALRILLSARREIAAAKTAQTNRLRALLLAGGDGDRDLARGPLPRARLASIAARRGHAGDTRADAVRRAEARRLALAVRDAGDALAANLGQLAEIADDLAPGLTARLGVGPVSAAQAIVSFSHPGRVRGEAAFAALAGASPIPASSGRTQRMRLNRGGDRQLNRALHQIALTRSRCCPRTRAYIARRRAEGKTDREIRRCLKRYIAKELYRALTTTMTS
jgi:transposase